MILVEVIDLQYIESKQNSRIKRWKKLLTKKGRDATKQCWLEGEHLVQEALLSNWIVHELIYSTSFIEQRKKESNVKPNNQQMMDAQPLEFVLTDELFTECCDTVTPQGIAAVVQQPVFPDHEQFLDNHGHLLLIIDQVRDPGNMGTIIRTADAAGVDAIFLGKGCADLFSGKVLRSTQGSLFHLPFYHCQLNTTLSTLKKQAWEIWGTSIQEDAQDYRKLIVEQDSKIAILVGNEGQGVQSSLLEEVDHQVKIPLLGAAESINVAVATGILLYHVQSQIKMDT